MTIGCSKFGNTIVLQNQYIAHMIAYMFPLSFSEKFNVHVFYFVIGSVINP